MASDHNIDRRIDCAKIASNDLASLNKWVVNMRGIVRAAKVRVIHKLCREIKKLKVKKGTDIQLEKNCRKVGRLTEEIFCIKDIFEDKVTKFALKNQDSFESLCMKSASDTCSRALCRLSVSAVMSERVNIFRKQNPDWQELAAYLHYTQTGRRFKTQQQKQRAIRKKTKLRRFSFNCISKDTASAVDVPEDDDGVVSDVNISNNSVQSDSNDTAVDEDNVTISQSAERKITELNFCCERIVDKWSGGNDERIKCSVDYGDGGDVEDMNVVDDFVTNEAESECQLLESENTPVNQKPLDSSKNKAPYDVIKIDADVNVSRDIIQKEFVTNTIKNSNLRKEHKQPGCENLTAQSEVLKVEISVNSVGGEETENFEKDPFFESVPHTQGTMFYLQPVSSLSETSDFAATHNHLYAPASGDDQWLLGSKPQSRFPHRGGKMNVRPQRSNCHLSQHNSVANRPAAFVEKRGRGNVKLPTNCGLPYREKAAADNKSGRKDATKTPGKEESDASDHPSWQAQRARKTIEKSAVFCGKKIKFDE